MTKGKMPKSWAEQLADLDDPAPKDFDPEDHGRAQSNYSSDEESSLDANEGRQHYEVVGKSKFRKPEPVTLGPQYTGSRVSRDALDEDESDDEPFGKAAEEEETSQVEKHGTSDDDIHRQTLEPRYLKKGGSSEDDDSDDIGHRPRHTMATEDPDQVNKSDSETSEGGHEGVFYTEFNSGTPGDDMEDPPHSSNDSSFSGVDADYAMDGPSRSQEDSESDISSASDAESPNGLQSPKEPSQRAQLREMMAESQKNLLSNISAAAKADAAKGKAIKRQRSTFDSLLNTRIKLQKALIATNSLATTPNSGDSDITESNDEKSGPKAIEAAERAALNLWNTIDSLRHTLHPQSSTPSKSQIPATASTATSTLWTRTHAHDTLALPNHRSTLTKWSNRINPPPLLSRSKFSQAPSQQPLTSVLDQQLNGTQAQKHLERARTPRSCAPLQAAKRVTHDGAVYDDADFYTVLLRELVEQRMVNGSSAHASLPATNGHGVGTEDGTLPLLPGMKDRALRVKKSVDTKASKGRKMRYTVHEKLQHFMAPEDRGVWGERQRAELFSGLLGRRVEMGEEMDVDCEGEDGDEDVDVEARREEQALMLFRR